MARKKKKNNRDARLSVVVNPSNQKQSVKSAMADDKDGILEVAHHPGRKGYALRCKESGLFYRVTADIRRFRVENPDSSFFDLYKHLHEKYPFIFDCEITKDNRNNIGGNFKKTIEAEQMWCQAYYVLSPDLIQLAEIRLEQILNREDVEDNIVIKAYDTLKKYEVAKIEEEDDSNKIVFGFSD